MKANQTNETKAPFHSTVLSCFTGSMLCESLFLKLPEKTARQTYQEAYFSPYIYKLYADIWAYVSKKLLLIYPSLLFISLQIFK